MSISSPARNMMKYMPTLPNSSNEASRARRFSPFSPISTPAKIMPMRCGMCSLLSTIGANRITHSTTMKIHVGSVIGRCKYVVIRSKYIEFCHKVRENIANLSFKSTKYYTFAPKLRIINVRISTNHMGNSNVMAFLR